MKWLVTPRPVSDACSIALLVLFILSSRNRCDFSFLNRSRTGVVVFWGGSGTFVVALSRVSVSADVNRSLFHFCTRDFAAGGRLLAFLAFRQTLSGNAKNGVMQGLIDQMKEDGLEPDVNSYNYILYG